ncbi:response regulator [Fodinibius salsisoli]|uniref:Response regulator n=1 Tax=Fodinibius salsisoli TaxID=2820877 RepID=A0ABT3PNN7_9BACT|nr:response regulator [Fodinibius salsisoli]MCW9707472.1 response regulator [Fodinibius salsisoli]
MQATKEIELIFIVDDYEEHNIMLEELLGRFNYRVETFNDGYKLLERLRKEIPTLIISDINMPTIDGFELYKEIRAFTPSQNVPVLFISSLDEVLIKDKIKELGAIGFIQKPILPEAIIKFLKTSYS